MLVMYLINHKKLCCLRDTAYKYQHSLKEIGYKNIIKNSEENKYMQNTFNML